ncbi:putative ABC transporter permease subunit [Thermoanaerobacter pentosaceus]|uniref:ABC-2 type transport system permease protein n=1 Tax=Thermoanaerobacter pentosaceus TaxID=694059 RepID=A0ABT9M7A9_9THEO|nr:hypothetical protein [Thermoanaerobacter pentosaceus]MDP9751997.1 ABC-2 type transport system permease protein [Thermoanaerobacter pentosaceus]
MREFLSFLRTQMKVYYGISAMKYKYFVRKKDLWEIVLATFGIAVGGGTLLFMYIMYLNSMYAASMLINQPQLMPVTVLLLAQLLTLVFGFFWTISVFYFSDDINILLPLPIQPYKIVLSKYSIILLNEYVTLAFLMLPAIFIYGIGTHAGILYYLVSFIVFIFTPIIPLSIAAIASVLIMRFVNLKRKKDLYTVIVSILALIFFFAIQFFINRIPQNGEQQAIENFILQNANLAKMISRSFPLALWGAVSMTNYNTLSGFLNLLMFIAVSIIFTAVLAVSAQKMYLKAVISGQEVEAKRKEVSLKKEIVRSSLLKALLLREWKLFIRVPVYAMNVLSVAIIIPFVFLVSFVGNPQIGFEMAIKYTSAPDGWFWVSMIGLFFSLFVGSNSLSSTSFSREGKMFYISKLMPVDPAIQLKAKWIFGIIITIVIILPTYVLGWYLFKIHLLSMVILIVLMLIGISAVNILSLLIDAMKPSFEWENPQKAMKGNLNVLLSLILTTILIVCIVGIVLLLKKLYVSEIIITLIIGILLILLNLGVYLLAKSAVKKLYKGE